MTKTISENKARQGRWGWHVLLVLVAGLVLAFAVWGGVEYYGEMIAQHSPGEQAQGPGG